jgi:Tfp pilus assembly ATPase PilU
MVTLDASLMALYQEGKIALEEAVRVADSPAAFMEKVGESR